MTDEDSEDIRRVISLSFRGLQSISDLDLERILSFDMEWLSPEEAETAVSKLIETGWLVGSRESLTPAFDAKNIATPIGWYPRPSRLLHPVELGQKKFANEEVTSESTNTATLSETKAVEQTNNNTSE